MSAEAKEVILPAVSGAEPLGMPEPRLEESLRRLEEIVRRLEQGSLELEEAIELYREGARLVIAANRVRGRVDQEVLAVIEEVNGELGLAPLART